MKKLLTAAMAFSFVALVAATASAQVSASDPSPADVTPAFGAGVLKKFQSVSATNQLATGTAFLNAAVDTVTLTTPGCILVTVDGEVALTGAENDISMNSQILIDGILGGGQVGQFYSPDDNDIGRFETEGHHSGRCGLGVGNHSVVWRFAASQASSTAFVRGRTMTSQFKK